MIALIIIVVAIVVICILCDDKILTVSIGLVVLLFTNTVFGNLYSDKKNSLDKQKNSLLSEYLSYNDKTEVLKKIEEHNQKCDEAEEEANNIWKNPVALYSDYDFDYLKIDIDNLND